MTATNKPMTGEQLDELMTVAVNMQRTSEEIKDRGAAMFAYAVQVAVMEVRDTRSKLAESQREFRAADATIENLQMQVEKLAAENTGLRHLLDMVSETGNANFGRTTFQTPATEAVLVEVRAQGVEMFASVLESRGRHQGYVEIANAYAAQLRKGVQS